MRCLQRTRRYTALGCNAAVYPHLRRFKQIEVRPVESAQLQPLPSPIFNAVVQP